MKTSELTGPKLAEWVARAWGWKVEKDGPEENSSLICWVPIPGTQARQVHSFGEHGYRPDLNWSQCGKLMHENCVFSLSFDRYEMPENRCYARHVKNLDGQYGDTPEIAICRAFVSGVYGDEVPEL